MSRFFVDNSEIGSTSITITDKTEVNHISRVLRLREGERVFVSDNEQWQYLCEIEEISRDYVELKILEKQSHDSEPKVDISLFQGIPKQTKMDLIVQKTTEIGVKNIIPVFMERTIVANKGNYNKKIERLNTIAEAAAKQSGRGIIPQVSRDISFDEMISLLEGSKPMAEILDGKSKVKKSSDGTSKAKKSSDVERENRECSDQNGFDLLLVPYENEEDINIKDVLRNLDVDDIDIDKGFRIAIVIGPEGGFAEEEIDALMAIDCCRCVTLGKRILRTETAGFVALADCIYELDLD